MTVLIAAPPRGRSWRCDARASFVAYMATRRLPVVTFPSPDEVVP